MNHPQRTLAMAALVAATLAPTHALAHWCHDLWGSAYNIVVKPATDSVAVPSGGSATLDVYVQNNMGYPLINFVLTADTSAAGYAVTSVTHESPKVANYLLPGESLKHTVTVSATSAGSLSVQQLNFMVNFGSGNQDQLYGTEGRPVMVKQTNGALVPPRAVPGLGVKSSQLSYPNDQQADHLLFAASADYGALNTALDSLVKEYCAGRGSWDHTANAPDQTYCSGTSTVCPPSIGGGYGTKFDYQHLWAASMLAVRKSALGSRLGVLRERLKCGWNDGNQTFRYFALVMLGYLGEDAGARTFLTNIIGSGSASAEDKLVAKAALLLFNNAADKTQYGADVSTGLNNTNVLVSNACAASLGIVNRDDAAVTSKLVPRAKWLEPDGTDDGKAFFAAHLLDLVAWDRRGWAVDSNDTGVVTFYGTGTTVDTTPPAAPSNVACAATSGGGIRVSWAQVTTNASGGAETMGTYRVYDGATGRPAGTTGPGQNGFDYDHVNTTGSIFRDFTALPGTAPHYFTVLAVDAAGNVGQYGAEVSCTPRYAPVAVIACTPLSGQAPLSVTCNSSGSTDPNGTSDITGRVFRLNGQSPQSQAQVAYNFTAAGSNVVQLSVTDSTGLQSSTTATIAVTTPGNSAPVAQGTGTPLSGPAPLTVAFSSAGSSDPDTGQTLSFSWDFGDGTATSTQPSPSHTFQNAGDYTVTLTVTDSASPPAASVALLSVHATGNQPPDVSTASASPASGAAPLVVTFDSSGVSDPDGDNVSVTWSFGDGSASSTARTTTHTYASAGTYTAQLSATDDGVPALAPVTASYTVVVSPPGQQNHPPDCATATVSPATGAAPLAITLDASGCTDPDGNAMSYRWRVPLTYTTEQTFDAAQATWTLDAPGTYTIKLEVTDDAPSPLSVNRNFQVTVGQGTTSEIVGTCGCTAASLPTTLLFAAASLTLWSRRRR